MELSVVILNYKSRGLVKNCLNAIKELRLDLPHELIVVDNDSNDGVDELLTEQFPDVKLVKSVDNLGMGGGNNLGIRQANGKYVLIVNPDIYFFEDAITKMLRYLENNGNAGLVAPRLLNPDRSLQFTCYRWHRLFTPLIRRTFLARTKFGRSEIRRFLHEDWDHSNTRPVDWIQGSCVMLPKRVLDEVGPFDERFFMYFEDTDLCRRIKEKGYHNIYLADASVIHLHHRQSAEGGLSGIFFNKLTRAHIVSWLKYLWKWGI